MARLTIPLNNPSDRHQVDLALDITYTAFRGGWVFYDILPSVSDQPILNEALLKRHRSVRAGALDVCDDERCGLLPAMRRFIESGDPDEWRPTDPDVTIAMKLEDWDTSSPADPDNRVVGLALAIDAYQWRHTTAYHGGMVRVEFTCRFAPFRRFYEDLRAEYLVFAAANDIKGYNIARGFHHPDHDWF